LLYAIVDIETTGGYAAANGITEIAVFVTDGMQVIQEFHTLLNPYYTIPRYVEALTGITNEMVESERDFKSIADGSIYSMDSANDSEKDLYLRIGTKLPVQNILYRMITKSSNFSTNLMVELVGAKNVNNTMRSLGAKDIQVLRGVEDGKAFDLGMNNTVTAYDLMVIFEHIANGTVVNKKACDAMIKVLMDQYFREIIPAKLPADVKTATKSGSIDKICHDSGIVFLPDGRKYVVVLLSRGIADQKSSTETLATVSRIIYDQVVSKN